MLRRLLCETSNWLTWALKGSREHFGTLHSASTSCVSPILGCAYRGPYAVHSAQSIRLKFGRHMYGVILHTQQEVSHFEFSFHFLPFPGSVLPPRELVGLTSDLGSAI